MVDINVIKNTQNIHAVMIINNRKVFSFEGN